jgi:hypothetical protein
MYNRTNMVLSTELHWFVRRHRNTVENDMGNVKNVKYRLGQQLMNLSSSENRPSQHCCRVSENDVGSTENPAKTGKDGIILSRHGADRPDGPLKNGSMTPHF